MNLVCACGGCNGVVPVIPGLTHSFVRASRVFVGVSHVCPQYQYEDTYHQSIEFVAGFMNKDYVIAALRAEVIWNDDELWTEIEGA